MKISVWVKLSLSPHNWTDDHLFWYAFFEIHIFRVLFCWVTFSNSAIFECHQNNLKFQIRSRILYTNKYICKDLSPQIFWEVMARLSWLKNYIFWNNLTSVDDFFAFCVVKVPVIKSAVHFVTTEKTRTSRFEIRNF
jgi:hypothetical protein